MNKGLRSRSFLRAATVASVLSIFAVLFLLIPASADHTFDTDVHMAVARSDLTEGSRMALTFSTLDGQPAPDDRHIYLAISGTATEGGRADFTITGPNGRLLPSIGETLYDRKVILPQGATSVVVRISTRNDSDAEQCETITIQGLQRDGSHKAFVGVLEVAIAANDLDRTPSETLPSVDLTQTGETWMATLNDPGARWGPKWRWHRSAREHGPWTLVEYNRDEYTLTDADSGYYLRAEARYDNSDNVLACAHVVWKEQGEINNNVNTNNHGNTNNGNSNNGNSNNGGNTDGNSNNGGNTDGSESKSTDTSDFSDLDSAGEHKGPLQTLDNEGVLDGTGCGDGLMCPGGPLLRWEAAVWLVRVLDGKNPDPVTTVRYTDVDATAWWAPYIERLAELGVTVGCKADPDIYCPDVKVPRSQMASFLARAFDLPAVEDVGFTDVGGLAHSANIYSAYTAGIIESCSIDPLKFCPSQVDTRGEFATYIIRSRTYAASG